MLKLLKTTDRWASWWRKRKVNWPEAYGSTVDHPHRDLLVEILRQFDFHSMLEIGCACAPNLVRVKRHWPDVQVGGVDVNPDAIREAQRQIPSGYFEVREADHLFFANDCCDAALSDACLIYFSKKRARKALSEMSRCAKRFIVLVEFHSDSWLSRLALKLSSGYNAHDWPKLLDQMGFHDVQMHKIPKEVWPGLPWERYGYVITARCPQKL